MARKNKQKMQKGGSVKGNKSNLGNQLGALSNAPYEQDPLEIAKALHSHFGKNPDKYKMSGKAFNLTPDVYKKYPNFSYVKNLPIIPKQYTTGVDRKTGQEFAYPAYSGKDIETYKEMSLGGILGSAGSFASMGSVFGPIGTAIGGGLGLVTGLIGHSKEKKKKKT